MLIIFGDLLRRVLALLHEPLLLSLLFYHPEKFALWMAQFSGEYVDIKGARTVHDTKPGYQGALQ